MPGERGTNAFIDEMIGLIDRYRKQWSLTYAEMIGALRIVTRRIEDEYVDAEQAVNDEDNDDEMPQGWGKDGVRL